MSARGKHRVLDRRKDGADGAGALRGQRPGGTMGQIAQFVGGSQHPFTGWRAYLIGRRQRARGRCQRNAGGLGHIGQLGSRRRRGTENGTASFHGSAWAGKLFLPHKGQPSTG